LDEDDGAVDDFFEEFAKMFAGGGDIIDLDDDMDDFLDFLAVWLFFDL